MCVENATRKKAASVCIMQLTFRNFDIIRYPISLSTTTGKPRKLHRCNFCNYSTLKTDHLRNHVLTHTGEKPFRCSFCGKFFTTKTNLKVHLKVHYKEQSAILP